MRVHHGDFIVPRATLLVGLLAAGAASSHAESVTYAIDPSHTFVSFEADHLGLSMLRGRFNRKTGSVTLDRAGKSGTAEITIDASSIDTGVPALDAQLKSQDFFNVAEFGSARFSADKFSFSGDKVSEVAGTLTLLGRTGAVTLKAGNFSCYINPLIKRETCGGDFETTITRTQFGMSSGLDRGLPDGIRLLIQIEAIRQ